MHLIDCARSKYKDDCTHISHITPQRLNLIVVYPTDDGMPSTKPAAGIIVVTVPVLV
jgi:hypothetical protein